MTSYEPFIHNDINGNSLTFHGGGQDDDGHNTVAVEADQIGRGRAWVHVRHTDAARVADELRSAAELPSVSRADIIREAIARIEDPNERAKSPIGLGLGWESAREVLRRMLHEEA